MNDALDFVEELYSAWRSHDVAAMTELYETKFYLVSEKHFFDLPWPSADALSEVIGADDGLFKALYEELAYRHLFNHLRPNVEAFVNTWPVYIALFDKILAAAPATGAKGAAWGGRMGPSAMVLPMNWCFDMVHEFIYQYHGMCQNRASLAVRTSEELSLLKENDSHWLLRDVHSYLRRLAKTGNVSAALQARARIAEKQIAAASSSSSSNDADLKIDLSTVADAGQVAPSSLHFSLGYFATTEMARLDCLIGDYASTLDTLTRAGISLVTSSSSTTSSSSSSGPAAMSVGQMTELYCQPLCTYAYGNILFHVGVALLMLRRYEDALFVLTDVSITLSRLLRPGGQMGGASSAQVAASSSVAGGSMRATINRVVAKLADKSLALLAVVSSLCPGIRLDEQASQMVLEKHWERARQLDAGDASTFTELVEIGVPRFITPANVTSILASNPQPTPTPAPATEGGEGEGENAAATTTFTPSPVYPDRKDEVAFTQVDVLMKDIRQQQGHPSLRSYLRLYSALNLQRLAAFPQAVLDAGAMQLPLPPSFVDENGETVQPAAPVFAALDGRTAVLSALLGFAHKTLQVTGASTGSLASGLSSTSTHVALNKKFLSDVHFCVHEDTLLITQSERIKKTEGLFIAGAAKCAEVRVQVEKEFTRVMQPVVRS